MGNYRPISILPVLSKMFEKIFLDKLEKFFEYFEIISTEQFGFRKNRSTADAITYLVQTVVDGLERREHVLSIFLDLSKAFDCVDHKILLQLLEGYGVRGVPLKWIASYLTDRFQCVRISNVVSSKVRMSHGVPQGSILGPVLFLIYVNHMKQSIKNGNMVQYADDTTLCLKAKTPSELLKMATEALNSCIEFFSKINLKTNQSKSNFIIFQLRNQNVEVQLPLLGNGVPIDEANNTKFLGIHLDRGLTWGKHVDQVCGKVASGIYVIRNLAKYCPLSVLKMAYFGLIYCHLAYGIRLWGSCSTQNLQRVFKLQKKAVRTIMKLEFRESCKNAFRELGFLTLPCLYVYEVVLFCRSKCNLVRNGHFHQYETRGRENLRIQNYRTNICRRLPSQAGVGFINKLPESIKNIKCVNQFKNRLKHVLVSGAYYSVDEFMMSSLDSNQ